MFKRKHHVRNSLSISMLLALSVITAPQLNISAQTNTTTPVVTTSRFNEGNRFLRWRVNNALVFTVENNNPVVGSRILLQNNNPDTLGMKWRYDDGQIIGLNNLCLGVSGTALQLVNCEGNSTRWELDERGRLVGITMMSDSVSFGCAQGNQAGDEGIAVILTNCSTELTQLFELEGTNVTKNTNEIEDMVANDVANDSNNSNDTNNSNNSGNSSDDSSNEDDNSTDDTTNQPQVPDIAPTIPTPDNDDANNDNNDNDSSQNPSITPAPNPNLPPTIPTNPPTADPAPAQPTVPTNPANNAVSQAITAENNLTVLTTALNTAGLTNTVNGLRDGTIFTPTDEAFSNLDPVVLNVLLNPANKDILIDVLNYHVSPTSLTSAEVISSTTIPTANGEVIQVTPGPILNGLEGFKFEKLDINVSNGVIIHKINKVLIPTSFALPGAPTPDPMPDPTTPTTPDPTPTTPDADTTPANQGSSRTNLPETNTATPATNTTPNDPTPATNSSNSTTTNSVSDLLTTNNLTTLSAGIESAGLVSVFDSTPNITVFAPTDEAFQKLDPEVLQVITAPENQDLLEEILLYHVVPKNISSTELLSNTPLTTVFGEPIVVDQSGNLNTNTALVTKDLPGPGDVVIHTIDTVLLNEKLQTSIDEARAKATSSTPDNTTTTPNTTLIPTVSGVKPDTTNQTPDLALNESKDTDTAILPEATIAKAAAKTSLDKSEDQVQRTAKTNSAVEQYKLLVAFPNEGANLTGQQLFKAELEGVENKEYELFWQSNNGNLNKMQLADDGVGKQAFVDLNDWNWDEKGPHTIKFSAFVDNENVANSQVNVNVS
jgi:uncharacterized surface protein with fasciclin (FAS1) repeats